MFKPGDICITTDYLYSVHSIIDNLWTSEWIKKDTIILVLALNVTRTFTRLVVLTDKGLRIIDLAYPHASLRVL